MASNQGKKGHQQNRRGQQESGGSTGQAADMDNRELDETEIILIVSELYLGGLSCSEIVAWMQQHYKLKISRRTPMKCLRLARQRGWLKVYPPGYLKLSNDIKKQYGWLEGLDVVRTPTSQHVALRGAVVLRRLVKKHAFVNEGKRQVHIGMTGGGQMRHLASEFVQLLCEPAEDWPEEVVIHAMVSGVRLEDPTTDPKAMFLSLCREYPDLQVKLSVVGFPGPGLVDSGQIDVAGLKGWDEIQRVIAEANRLDIIVTSAGNWKDDHCVYSQTMKNSHADRVKLEAAGIVGDYFYWPFNQQGAIAAETRLSVMTLLELGHLPEFIAAGKKVLFLLGPCDECDKPKPAILRVLLDQPEHLFTHLVVDSRSARHAFQAA